MHIVNTAENEKISGSWNWKTRKAFLWWRNDANQIKTWRNALSQVADITGFELETCNGKADVSNLPYQTMCNKNSYLPL